MKISTVVTCHDCNYVVQKIYRLKCAPPSLFAYVIAKWLLSGEGFLFLVFEFLFHIWLKTILLLYLVQTGLNPDDIIATKAFGKID